MTLPRAGGGVQRVALVRREVLGAQHLVAILAAADVEEVVGVRVERRRRGRRRSSSKPMPRQSQRRSSSSRLPRSA